MILAQIAKTPKFPTLRSMRT